MIRNARIELFRRHGDGCYLTIFGHDLEPSPGRVDVPLSRDQAVELSLYLADMADSLGPGMVHRHHNGTTFAYRMRQ